MQLDHTHIAVRERSLLDTFDLALHVYRIHFRPLILLSCLGAVPFVIINHFLLSWMILGEERETFFYADDVGAVARFVWAMSALIVIEAPLAAVLSTAYIGQALFVERPSIAEILRDVGKMWPQLSWCQLLLRGVLASWVLLATVERHGEFDPNFEVVLLGGLTIYVLGIRLWRPFINEIILLERNPVFSRVPGALTVSRRSRQLHGPSSGDLFFRGFTTGAICFCLTIATFGTFLFGAGVLFNDWTPGPMMVTYLLPLSMWIVVGFSSVVRFLNYLDLRIRHEGWEVELRLRAEGERLANRVGVRS